MQAAARFPQNTNFALRLLAAFQGHTGLQNQCSRAGASSFYETAGSAGPGRSRTLFHSAYSKTVLPCRRQLDFRRTCVCAPRASLGTSVFGGPPRTSKTMLPCRRQHDFQKHRFRETFSFADPLPNRRGNGVQNRGSHAGASSFFARTVLALREPL